MLFLLINDIHITENTVFSKHILTFKICAVTPFIVYGKNFIIALVYKFCYIKFSSIMRAFGIANIFAVNIKCQSTCNAEKRNNLTAVFFQFNILFVNADSNILRNVRWLFREWITSIDIRNLVISVSLPGAWNG